MHNKAFYLINIEMSEHYFLFTKIVTTRHGSYIICPCTRYRLSSFLSCIHIEHWTKVSQMCLIHEVYKKTCLIYVFSLHISPRLRPFLFLCYIKDLPLSVDSKIRLFADDCLIYREINSIEDKVQLQKDLESLQDW